MSKVNIQPNVRVQQIFDDLEKYLKFCVDYGYKFDEADLYNQKSYQFRQYNKFVQGKPVKDNWEELASR